MIIIKNNFLQRRRKEGRYSEKETTFFAEKITTEKETEENMTYKA